MSCFFFFFLLVREQQWNRHEYVSSPLWVTSHQLSVHLYWKKNHRMNFTSRKCSMFPEAGWEMTVRRPHSGKSSSVKCLAGWWCLGFTNHMEPADKTMLVTCRFNFKGKIHPFCWCLLLSRSWFTHFPSIYLLFSTPVKTGRAETTRRVIVSSIYWKCQSNLPILASVVQHFGFFNYSFNISWCRNL